MRASKENIFTIVYASDFVFPTLCCRMRQMPRRMLKYGKCRVRQKWRLISDLFKTTGPSQNHSPCNQFFGATHHPPLAVHRIGPQEQYLSQLCCEILIPCEVRVARVVYFYMPLPLVNAKRYVALRWYGATSPT